MKDIGKVVSSPVLETLWEYWNTQALYPDKLSGFIRSGTNVIKYNFFKSDKGAKRLECYYLAGFSSLA